MRSRPFVRAPIALALACLGLLLSSGGCGGSSPLTPSPPRGPTPTPMAKVQLVSSDPFNNISSQHATEVEPDIAVSGMTVVAVFQQGRFFTAGSSDIGVATSLDGGSTWTQRSLPGTTTWSSPSGPYDSVSDPSIAYDAKHAVWLAAMLPILFSATPTPGGLVSRSADGLTWSASPAAIAPGQASTDKGWIACDSSAGSPHYGNCYYEWDDPNANGLIHMSTSSDGGLTWSAPSNTAGNATGLGGQPVVQSNGTVIVPIDDINEANVLAFSSHDGGATWSSPILVSAITDRGEGGGLRSGPLVSGTIDASGKVYIAWQDCSFRAGCAANDIVMSTSTDGTSWSAVARVPIDATSSGVDHFLPGLGVDPATSGAGAHLGLTYFYYPNANCSVATCALYVGFIGSMDGGATWGAPTTLAGPMSLSWLANTNQGSMVGDYSATAFAATHPVSVFAVASPNSGALFAEAMYAPLSGVLTLASAVRRSSAGERRVPGVGSNHGPRLRPPIR